MALNSGSAETAVSDAVASVLAEARKEVARLGELPSARKLRELLGRRWEHVREAHKLLTLERAALLDPPATGQADPVPTTAPDAQATPDQAEAPAPGPDPLPVPTPDPVPPQPEPAPAAEPGPAPFPRWPLLVLAAGAFVAVWSGWVGLGRLTGFGLVNLLPGFVPDGSWSTLDTAITLPLGVEAYGAFALAAFLSGRIPARARRFAAWSAAGSLIVGAAGQASYHLLVSHPAWLTTAADGTLSAPVPIVIAVSTLPVAVLGMGATLAHLVRTR